MKIDVFRFLHAREETISRFLINDRFQCVALEDQAQAQKIFGETRIPAGSYEVIARRHGGMHARYQKRFGRKFHPFMLEIANVPGFTDILIHIGNTDADTAGCPLIGDSYHRFAAGRWQITASTDTYERVYPIVRDALLSGERTVINMINDPA